MLNLNPERHLKTLRAPLAAAIAEVWNYRLDDEIKSEIIANLLEGQDLKTATRNAKCDTWRAALRPSGWASFDDEPEADFKGNKKKNLKESIASKVEDDVEIEAKTRLTNASSECLLTLVGKGTEAIGRELKIGQRRAQQKLKKLIEDLESPTNQADLFWGDRS